MFNCKKTSLFETKNEKTASSFVQTGLKNAAYIPTGNGGEAYNSTGNPFVDQFGNTAAYLKPRAFKDIAKDCEILWAENKLDCVKFIFFLRMICRKVETSSFTTEKAQKGSELRYEGIMRLIWLHTKDKELFWKNAHLIPFAGSWKDLFVMLRYDLMFNGWEGRVLDWDRFGKLILAGLRGESQVNLIKKYLPQIKTRSKCTTVEAQANCSIAKWLCSLLYGGSASKSDVDKYTTYRNYARMKASGTAHNWQQLISKGKYGEINFDTIHGRALKLLVNSKFLDNHGLRDKYQEWIGSPETKDVKYTGFVHELFKPIAAGHYRVKSVEKYLEDTINKQFMTLVNKAKDDEISTNLIVVRDTSGSMVSEAPGTNMSCYDIAKAIALYFSHFLTGKFSNAWIEFHTTAKMHIWSGETPIDKWKNDHSNCVGNTNFESVLKLFVSIKAQGIPEEEFPRGILCISDGEFNPASLKRNSVESAKEILRVGGFSEEYINDFVICLWNLQNNYYDKGRTIFQTYGDVRNVFYMSGYSAQIVSFLNGKISTTRDLFDEAMDQEFLRLIQI